MFVDLHISFQLPLARSNALATRTRIVVEDLRCHFTEEL